MACTVMPPGQIVYEGRCEQFLGDFWPMPLADDPREN
jgi:hypothetical protein